MDRLLLPTHGSGLRKLLLAHAMGGSGVVEKTVTGPIVTVTDALAKPAKSLVVNFSPVQAAGTPAPDNVLPITGWTGVTVTHGGENLLDKTTVLQGQRLTTQGENYGEYGYYASDYINVEEGKSYCKNSPEADAYHRWCTYDASKVFVRAVSDSNTITIASGEKYVRMCGRANELSSANVISGTTYPVDWGTEVNKTIYSDGSLISENGMSATGYISVTPGEVFKYTFTSSEAGRSRKIYGYDSSKSPVSTLAGVGWVNVGTTHTLTATIPSGVSYIRISFVTNDTDISIVESNSGAAYVIARQEIGTVYGGYVDLVSGELVVEWYKGTITNVMNVWNETLPNTVGGYSLIVADYGFPANKPSENSKAICDCLKMGVGGFDSDNVGISIGGNPQYIAIRLPYSLLDGVTVQSTAIEKRTAMNLYLAENPVTLVYVMGTPVTYQLDPQTVAMLSGTNNVWSNANGDVSLTYLAKK